jgi:hypothetical protein
MYDFQNKTERGSFMKKRIGFVFILGLVLSSTVFAQTANRAYSAVIREAQSYVNSCGPSDWPQWAVDSLNWISGNPGACNQHDIDYGTLGMSRSDADDRLFSALRLGSWTSVPAVASGFWTVVRAGGGDDYNKAQRQSREEFKRIHHGNEWIPSYGRWHPSNGHLRMSFPQCIDSCIYLTR